MATTSAENSLTRESLLQTPETRERAPKYELIFGEIGVSGKKKPDKTGEINFISWPKEGDIDGEGRIRGTSRLGTHGNAFSVFSGEGSHRYKYADETTQLITNYLDNLDSKQKESGQFIAELDQHVRQGLKEFEKKSHDSLYDISVSGVQFMQPGNHPEMIWFGTEKLSTIALVNGEKVSNLWNTRKRKQIDSGLFQDSHMVRGGGIKGGHLKLKKGKHRVVLEAGRDRFVRGHGDEEFYELKSLYDNPKFKEIVTNESLIPQQVAEELARLDKSNHLIYVFDLEVKKTQEQSRRAGRLRALAAAAMGLSLHRKKTQEGDGSDQPSFIENALARQNPDHAASEEQNPDTENDGEKRSSLKEKAKKAKAKTKETAKSLREKLPSTDTMKHLGRSALRPIQNIHFSRPNLSPERKDQLKHIASRLGNATINLVVYAPFIKRDQLRSFLTERMEAKTKKRQITAALAGVAFKAGGYLLYRQYGWDFGIGDLISALDSDKAAKQNNGSEREASPPPSEGNGNEKEGGDKNKNKGDNGSGVSKGEENVPPPVIPTEAIAHKVDIPERTWATNTATPTAEADAQRLHVIQNNESVTISAEAMQAKGNKQAILTIDGQSYAIDLGTHDKVTIAKDTPLGQIIARDTYDSLEIQNSTNNQILATDLGSEEATVPQDMTSEDDAGDHIQGGNEYDTTPESTAPTQSPDAITATEAQSTLTQALKAADIEANVIVTPNGNDLTFTVSSGDNTRHFTLSQEELRNAENLGQYLKGKYGARVQV